ncbi:uncharacterized protein LOC141620774 [Silene latifolia]|uniref:uncharacterized protein LOC141620774 n=1 Tax=Silene latifolia TaxID=37657 RepID=UPI003D76C7D3
MRGPNLSNDDRHRIGCYLFENSKDGKPIRGLMNFLAAKYQVDRKTIFEVWRVAKRQRENGDSLQLNSRIKGKKGRERLEVPIDRILATPIGEKGSLHAFGETIGISATTIFNWVKQGKLRSHTSTLHSSLTDENMFNRLIFSLSKLSYDKISNSLKFKDMGNIVHIDEKWFYISQDGATFFLLSEEIDPYRHCQSKSFITKVMFMAAVSRPIYDGDGNLLFDGKIGIFPFTFQDPAKRRSKNRPTGTLEIKSMASINKQVTKDMLINKVIPAIHSKWPASMSKEIIIQQDNAKPHIKGNDLDFLMAANSNGFNISLTQQPPNSPDLNVLDLGFFNSIQSLQAKTRASTIDKLVSNVLEAWDEEPAQCLSDVWLSL